MLEDFLIDLGGIFFGKFLFPLLLEDILVVAGNSTTHIGHLFGLADDAALNDHELVEALALGFIAIMECQIIGIRVLAFLYHHALHANVGAILVVKSVSQGVGSHFGYIGLDHVEDSIILGTEDDALEMGLVPVILGTVLLKETLQSYGVLACSLPNTTVADLEQQHAVTILIEQVAVFGVALDQFLAVIFAQSCIGNSVDA